MRTILLALAAATIALSPARADDAALSAAQSTITSQIEAFLAGEDDLAYSFAAPQIQRLFPSRDAFMRMVREGYAPVHRPRSFGFGPGEMSGPGRIAQQVFVIGPDGQEYEALYTLELQPDGSYRITGVHLRRARTIGS